MTYEEALATLRNLKDKRGRHPIMCDNDRCAVESTIVSDPLQRQRIRQWVQALRREIYQQGRYDLYNATRKTFCCMGVYCSAIDGVPLGQLVKLQYPNSLPNSSWPLLRSYNRAFAAMNDQGRLTFNEIADIIEATLLRPVPKPNPYRPGKKISPLARVG